MTSKFDFTAVIDSFLNVVKVFPNSVRAWKNFFFLPKNFGKIRPIENFFFQRTIPAEYLGKKIRTEVY